MAVTVSCSLQGSGDKPATPDSPESAPIEVNLPAPQRELKSVSLTEADKNYADAGNRMGFRVLKQLYSGTDVVFSPLSLQYALAMTANGASGATLQELVDFLGFGDIGLDALNEYCRILMEELPAVDLQSTLRVVNALLADDSVKLLHSFQETLASNYYAAVENMPFENPEAVASRVNDWADRCTDGFIKKVLEPEDFSPQTIALIMNALYFKAKWSGSEHRPMFVEDSTTKEQFRLSDGSQVTVPMMHTSGYYQYAEMDGYTVLALPFSNGNYRMYFLLPQSNDIQGLIDRLPGISWRELAGSLNSDAEVFADIPRFEVENRYSIDEAMKALGVQMPFSPLSATFDRMMDGGRGVFIEKIIQKAKIAVTEWGTEAAAVSVVMMGEGAIPPEEHKQVFFKADHPFVFAIGEVSSGVLLFEGVYGGAAAG